MKAEDIILAEFRENVEAICSGNDPLEDPQYFVRYMGMFDQPEPDVTFGEIPPECSIDGCDKISRHGGLCGKHHFEKYNAAGV